MYRSKKEVDAHVRTSLSKLRSESERNLRSFTIAKLYYKINEYATAEQFLHQYIKVKEDNDQAHKLLGQCYLHLKNPEKALQSFQRSLQINPKQKDVLIDVCKLLIDEKHFNNKAKYWCDLAESENVQDDAVFSLRLKLMNKDNVETNQIESLIQKEIIAHPDDVHLRVRLVRHYIDQNMLTEAFRYVFDLEMSQNGAFSDNGEWYNIVWLVLTKYEQLKNAIKSWDFWLLLIICLERQVYISFSLSSGSITSGISETANLLFSFDQYLYKISQLSNKLNAQKELFGLFMNHYRGQLLLHSVSLILKRELVQKKNKWRETMKSVLPLVLFAYHSASPEKKEPWMKHCKEQDSHLIQLWNREGAFRCAQVGRTLLSCISESLNKDNGAKQSNNVLDQQSMLWSSGDELMSQIRKICSDKQWRKNIFSILFNNSSQKIKEQTSLLIGCSELNEPLFELPTYAEVERYEEIAQYLKPQSLQHMVYLCLGNDNLAHVRCKFFHTLSLSTQNLAFCGAESLNQLDIETFLCAATIQAKRMLEIDRETFHIYHSNRESAAGRLTILPFVNLQNMLCTEEQKTWWTSAYRVYKNLDSNNFTELRANLQYGIEAVRGINGPKIDVVIVFKLGEIFVMRSQDVVRPMEKAFLEARAENLYKYGLSMLKMKNKGVLEPFRKYFKYAKSNSSKVERKLASAAESAVTYLAERYFKKSQYEELIEELSGVQLPFATYLQAEAYRKLDEANKTPKKSKRAFLDRASECLNQTLVLLNNTQTDPNHPLNSIVHSEMKRLQSALNKFSQDNSFNSALQNNSSIYEEAEEASFGEGTPTGYLPSGYSRSHRDTTSAVGMLSPHITELENLVKQMAKTLLFVKEEIVDTLKPEVVSIRKEMSEMKDKISQLEDALKKTHVSPNPPSRDEPTNMLDDLYMIEDALQNQMYQQNQQVNTNMSPQIGANLFGNASNSPSPFVPHAQQRVNTSNAVHMPPPNPAAVAAYNNSLFNPSSMNYYTSSYLMQPQAPGALGMLGQPPMPYVDSTGMNFNMLTGGPLLPQPNPDSRSRNLYGMLGQQPGVGSNIPQLSVPMPMTQLAPPPPISTSAPIGTVQQSVSFNKTLNNQPVEKGPPANVVITTSDPLPNPNTVVPPGQQPTLSVKIPSHHIKQSLVQTSDSNAPSSVVPPAVSSTMSGFDTSNSTGVNIFSKYNPNMPLEMTSTSSPLRNTLNGNVPITAPPATSIFSFKPQIEQAKQLNALNEDAQLTDDSFSSNPNKSGEGDVEYDPRPDFKPIIPLPDEVIVKTGEEDEIVMFNNRAKLYRHVDNEWKERGIGCLKILKSQDGYSRVLMRREQTHKICANHKITSDLKITQAKNQNKALIWAANDFADEEIKLETFLVRFKSPEIAQEFLKAFVHAQKEAEKLLKGNVIQAPSNKETTQSQVLAKPPFELTKSKVGNFATSTPSSKDDTVSSAPSTGVTIGSSMSKSTITTTNTTTSASKSLFSEINLATKIPEPVNLSSNAETKSQAAPFANFTFDKVNFPGGASPFANLTTTSDKSSTFNLANPAAFWTPPASSASTEGTANKSQTSDVEDEYVPTAQFNPVIPLPDLVEVATGEENEIILFEHRAKLLRFDKNTSEWKERGLGNIKLLQDKDDVNKVRLVMRREQVHKLCCNQRLYKDTSFKYAKNSKTALCWAGQDYSENELITEMLTIRFKTPEICQSFYDAIVKAQSQMDANALESAVTAEKEPQKKSAEKSNVETKGFGNAFKPKPGSWSCNACYISNKSDELYCVACDTPKDDTVPKKTSNDILNAKPTNFTFGFGSANSGQPTSTDSGSAKPAFTFGIPQTATATQFAPTPATTVTKPFTGNGFGDQFKPKEGSWTCQECYLANEGDKKYCNACDAPKDDTVPKKESANVFALSDNAPKFSFGFPSGEKTADKPSTGGFVFGASAELTKPTIFGGITNGVLSTEPTKSFSFTTSTETPSFGATLGKSTFSFSLAPKVGETASGVVANGVNDSNATFSLNKKDFCFTLKPKSPGKAGKSDIAGDEGDDGEYHEEEEENNTYFTPVIPLPDKIDVKTGEEDEEVLYVHRAKLFRFNDGEWKERGVGDLKILRHKQNRKLRVVMRRDQVLKICLNHALNEEVEYKMKDDKSWLFVVNDFSEGQVELEKLSLRFKTREIAQGFSDAVKTALAGTAKAIDIPDQKLNSLQTPSVDVHKISDNDKELADKLKLPYDFFTNGVDCSGCRGCDPDSFIFPEASEQHDEDTENPLPLEMPMFTMPTTYSGILKQSKLMKAIASTDTNSPIKEPENLFSGLQLRTSFGQAEEQNTPTFSFTSAFNSIAKPTESKPETGGFLFGSKEMGGSGGSIFGEKSIFGQQGTVFGSKPIFGYTPSMFGNSDTKIESTTSIFGSASVNSDEAAKNNSGSLFKSSSSNLFGSAITNQPEQDNSAKDDNIKQPSLADLCSKSGGIDFASLAAKANEGVVFSEKPGPGGFIGLTNQNAFSSFLKPTNDISKSATLGNDSMSKSDDASGSGYDENYDPHYEPVIALPNEIVVSTGEENEVKLFGERCTLYRWDGTNKEWKERGIGELKILKHSEHGTYRMIMRREQIHKLVLNHSVGAKFQFNNMVNNPRGFVWATMNYAESAAGELEKLAVRFKKEELAIKFSQKLIECITAAKERQKNESEA